VTAAPRIRIALILPRAGIYRYGTGAFSLFLRYSPMTLVTLAALVPPELDADVSIFDEGIEVVHRDRISADIVGITGITGASHRTYAYADYFRSRGCYVVIGGVHATLLPEEAQEHADTVVTGQAFESWPRFLRDWAAGAPRRRYGAPRKLDFAHYRIPSRSLLKKKGYVTTNSTQAVFGCPNACEFCVTPVVCRAYQGRPIPQVIEDIASMGGTYFAFVDPSPIENVRYATDLYRAIVPLRKKWTGLATTRLVRHRELMDVMEESGCRGLLIGFESLSQGTNDAMRKGFSRVAEYHTLARELHRRGIAIMGCFVHGLDGDERECFERTLDFVMEADIDLPRFTICTPFPGTPFFRRLKREGRILTENWALYDAQHVVFRPARMSVESLEAGHHDIWRRAYTLGAMARRLAGSRTFLQFTVLANLAYRTYGRRLPAFSSEYMANRDAL